MGLHLHRAGRADVLADGLAALLATPLEDPFATEVVVVPARGMERWLYQRLSHVLGAGGAGDGVCAGVDFRSPWSLRGEITGTRDDDPWAPDPLAWPVLAALDESLDEPWAATLARHLGHGLAGEEGDLRRGRRYAVARRVAGLFAAYAQQRPAVLADWTAGSDTDGVGDPVPADLAWQPHLWRRVLGR
ncbi:MAG: exodeoxyribonuclease V subunit gamma, partial [Mycobacterium sp.]|nr:exodeoxyribonuclease V subunit gamma [Mycobacterium sp.]